MKEILRVEITDLKIKGNLLIGDLWFDPWNIYVDDYAFGEGDTVIIDNEETYIDMDSEYLMDLAYGV